ncbi:hypothetical protein FRC07_003310 [Ceratobasidium sp. 392]|nr:hypothetical protein FRC07_003310 [Ceratobasidium sp. 392]
MSVRISAAANDLVRLWTRKVELVGEKAFGADNDLKTAVTSDPPALHKAMRTVMDSIERLQFSAFPVVIASLFTQILVPSWRKSYGTVSEFVDNKITHARAQESELSKLKQGEGLATDADCVVDMIAQREAREGAERLPRKELREELMTYIMAGQDTTAVELAWLVKFLPLDMNLQRQLKEEVCAAFGSGSEEDEPLDFETLNDSEKVPLLEAVVAESLRCARIAPNVVRELLKSLTGALMRKAGGRLDGFERTVRLTARRGQVIHSESDSVVALDNVSQYVIQYSKNS